MRTPRTPTGRAANRRLVVVACALLVSIGVLWLARDAEPEDRSPLQFGAEADRDIAYGTEPRNRLDVYTPPTDGPHPTIIWLHPGGWVTGDKAATMPVWDWIERGYAIVAVNYRYAVAPATVADAVDDANAAVQFVIDHHGDWQLDPGRIGVYGFSAGGHLAAMVAHEDPGVAAVAIAGAPTDFAPLLDPDDAFFDGARGPEVVTLVRERLGCADTPDDCDERARAVSPAQLAPGSADLLIVHGDRDPIVAVDQAIRLHDHLVAEGAVPQLVIVEGGGHLPHVEEGGIATFFDERLLS